MTMASTSASTPRAGGFRDPNDDIRRLASITRALAMYVLGYGVADGWCHMVP